MISTLQPLTSTIQSFLFLLASFKLQLCIVKTDKNKKSHRKLNTKRGDGTKRIQL